MAIDPGTIIDGAVRTDSINSGGLPIDMEPETALLDPNSYVFEALTRQINKKLASDQMKHEYRERRLIPAYCKLTNAAAVGDTHLDVDEYTRIKNDMLLYSPTTNEMFLVQDASIDASVTIVRVTGSGGVVSAIASGAPIMILMESHAEGEEVPDAYTVGSVSKYNYIMQSDRRVQSTDIDDAVKHYDSTEDRDRDRQQAFIEYKRAQNLLYYVGIGTREIVSASGKRRHCCSGLIERLTENGIDLSGAGPGLTVTTLANLLSETTFNGQSSPRKLAIFGTNGWSAISAWPTDALQVSPMTKQWGIRVNTIITGYGDLDVAHDPTLRAQYGLEDKGFVLDMPFIRQLFLRGLPVRMFLNIPNLSTLHSTVDAISGTFGLQVKFEELHAAITGIK